MYSILQIQFNQVLLLWWHFFKKRSRSISKLPIPFVWLLCWKISVWWEWNAASNCQHSWLGKRYLLIIPKLICFVLAHTCFSENITFSFCFFNAGAGFDMLVEMLRYISPTLVVQIRITAQSKNLPDGMFWLDDEQTGPEMININAAFHDALNRS